VLHLRSDGSLVNMKAWNLRTGRMLTQPIYISQRASTHDGVKTVTKA